MMASKSKMLSIGTSSVMAQVTQPFAGQKTLILKLFGSQFASFLSAIKQSEAKLEHKFADFRSDMKEAQEECVPR